MNGELLRHGRALAGAAAPGVAASWLAGMLVSLFGGGGTTALLGGRPENVPGPHQWALLALAVGGWAYAVSAVMIVAAGALAGTPVAVRDALRYAARRWLAIVGVLALLAVYAIVLLVAVALLSFGSGWLAAVLLVIAAVLLSRFTYALPAAAVDGIPGTGVTRLPRPPFGDEPWDPDKPAAVDPGARYTTADALRTGLGVVAVDKTGAFFLFLGVVAAGVIGTWVIGLLPARSAHPLVVAGIYLVELVIITAVVAVQGGLLARSRLWRVRELLPGSPPSRSGWAIGAAAVLLAVTVGAGVTAWDPTGVPVLTVHPANTSDRAAGAGPDGVLTDRLPGRGEERYAAVTALPDGRRLAVTDVLRDEGTLAVCRVDSCETVKTAFAGAGERWDRAAITMTPAGDVVVAALAWLKTGATVVLWACPGTDCAHARRTEVPESRGMLSFGGMSPSRPAAPTAIAVGTDDAGVPVVGWSDDDLVRQTRCVDRTCSALGDTVSLLPRAWPLTITGGEPVPVALGFDPRGLLTAAFVAPAPDRRPGFQLRIGTPVPRDRYALAHCTDPACAQVTLRPWQSAPAGSAYAGGWIAYTKEGLPLLVLAGETEVTTVLCARDCF
ncbi:hypothetical protein [Hamadaea tsunoensis]|uniref:hypothetical protein n=1 Tax=Hamadaea tsunoensis TaxID=53368 RepID=UPI0003F7AEC5|nr:hypothetical protein [Hamadaea tsunoensis]